MKNILLLILLIVAISCKENGSQEPTSTPSDVSKEEVLELSEEQLQASKITFASIVQKQVSGLLFLNGKIDINPDEKLTISSPLGGHVTSINVLPGKMIKKGTVILTVQDQQLIQLQQDYLTTQASLVSAQLNFERQKALNSSQSSSDKTMQQAEAEYKSLLATKRGIEEKLRLLSINPSSVTSNNIRRSMPIVAPFNGVVAEVLVNKGRYVTPSDALVELINPNGFLLNLTVFEKDLPEIEIGQLIEASTNDQRQGKIKAKVITKGIQIKENGTSEVMAQVIGEPSIHLAVGLYITAQLEVERKTAYLVPSESVVSFEGSNYVFLAEGQLKFRLQKVTVGTEVNQQLAIVNYADLEHKKIVQNGAYGLLMALKNKAE